MLNYLEFISKDKSMLIAPAGFGKTHAIAECLNHSKDKGKQLILTHTHAGVASIKEKIKKQGISNSSYSVETIMSFAQKYTLSFYNGSDIPKQDNSEKYYPFLIEKATELFKLNPIKQIIVNSYKGLFVDEYQDCTLSQHKLILALSESLKTRILGDYLQGIYGFNSENLVDLEDTVIMGEFAETKYELDEPQRWLRGNNTNLGSDLYLIRNSLLKKMEIDLEKYSSIELHKCSDIYEEKYNVILDIIKNENNLLIIDPITTNIHSRIKFIQRFNNIPSLVESIYDKDFYKTSSIADKITEDNVIPMLSLLCDFLFNKTEVNKWLKRAGLVKKKNDNDKTILKPLENILNILQDKYSSALFSIALKEVYKLPNIKCYRKELFYTFCKALEQAEYGNITVFIAMTNIRNLISRMGRKLFGKSVGTTLLTKGLEFDTVLIINAHKFDSPKHLYVALTRASKRLIIFTEKTKLNPY
ncbi:MAG: AAA family ATPase [Ignavibacteriae bacterium]|nr:AAA family ATPase [Ignavibacteriota bacterium]